MKKNTARTQGFTLIELLLVIGIIATLAVTVFVALNPAQRFKDARDARRNTDVETILSAVHSYIVDNKGTTPAGLTTADLQLSTGTGVTGCTVATGGCSVVATGCLDLSTTLNKYLKTIPVDPSLTNTGSPQKTNYAISMDANGLVTVKSCGTEGTSNISASR